MNKKIKPQRGTVGYEVAKLVKRYGNHTAGLTILEMALEQAAEVRAVGFFAKGTDKHVYLTQTPGWCRVAQDERDTYARCGIVFFSNRIAYRHMEGKPSNLVEAKLMNDGLELSAEQANALPVAWHLYNLDTGSWSHC